MEERDDDYEVLDVDTYTGEKDKAFSHQLLIMSAMRKAIEAGNKEMRNGYFNEKLDKFGNRIRTYIPDTRLEYIQSVRSVEAMMIGDLNFSDETIEIKKEIEKIKIDLENIKSKLYEKEKKDIESASSILKNQRLMKGIYLKENSLNKNFQYYQEYIDESVEAYEKILKQLVLVTHEMNFYQQEMIEG